MPTINISPRKAPRQQRSEATVAAILQGATRVLSRESLAGFNTNRVAEVAGVSVGSLYQYFEDKEQILFELLQNLAHQRIARFRKAVEVSALLESPEEIVSRVVDSMFEFNSEKDILLEAALVPSGSREEQRRWSRAAGFGTRIRVEHETRGTHALRTGTPADD